MLYLSWHHTCTKDVIHILKCEKVKQMVDTEPVSCLWSAADYLLCSSVRSWRCKCSANHPGLVCSTTHYWMMEKARKVEKPSVSISATIQSEWHSLSLISLGLTLLLAVTLLPLLLWRGGTSAVETKFKQAINILMVIHLMPGCRSETCTEY